MFYFQAYQRELLEISSDFYLQDPKFWLSGAGVFIHQRKPVQSWHKKGETSLIWTLMSWINEILINWSSSKLGLWGVWKFWPCCISDLCKTSRFGFQFRFLCQTCTFSFTPPATPLPDKCQSVKFQTFCNSASFFTAPTFYFLHETNSVDIAKSKWLFVQNDTSVWYDTLLWDTVSLIQGHNKLPFYIYTGGVT